MKLFISYCEKNGQGLAYARRAKSICKQRNVEAWVWRDDSNSAKWLKSDIATGVDSCHAMLTLVTSGTESSEPQKQEWSLADSLNKTNSSLRMNGLLIPLELRSRACLEFIDSDFEEVCNKVMNDIVDYLNSDRPTSEEDTSRIYKEYQISDIAKKLEKRQDELNERAIEEFSKSVWEGYLGSAIIRNIVRLSEANEKDKDNLRNIVIYSSIELDKFNAQDYWWGPAFRQLGREIAIGEEKALIKNIQAEIKGIKESCNEKNDELSIIQREIERLNSIGHMPDVILAPPSMLKSFVHFFKEEKGKVDFTRELGSAATLEAKDLGGLRIYLLGQGILNDNVIVFNRSSVVWEVLPYPETGYALTMGIGRDIYPDKVKFIIGTTIRCALKIKEGISIIPIER